MLDKRGGVKLNSAGKMGLFEIEVDGCLLGELSVC